MWNIVVRVHVEYISQFVYLQEKGDPFSVLDLCYWNERFELIISIEW